MGMMDDMKSKMSDMDMDEMRKLTDKEEDGSISEDERMRLSELRAKMTNH